MIKLNKISHAFLANSGTNVLAKSICATAVLSIFAFPATSQESPNTSTADEDMEVIQVKGIRKTMQDSISIKKLSTSIVDGMSADDIGDLPALSIGEALENLTGASSHREQGGATEISIRGLGPFLGSTVFNGREAANGSGDRSVNFSQFPSELFNKIEIYKTQEASLIEGGVSGQISLSTLKPLDYGKRRFQVQAKGSWSPAENDIDNSARNIGSRLTASYVDQFETENFGEIGFSIGGQKRLSTNPEQEARSTSGFADCRIDPNTPAYGIYSSSGDDCDDDDSNANPNGDGGVNYNIDPATGLPIDNAVPYVFSPSSYSYRQNTTDDDRESIFGAIQWRPNEKFELNVDAEYSNRDFTEIRNDLVFANSKRLDDPTVVRDGQFPVDLVVTDTGSLVSGTNYQRIETLSTYIERLEEYKGGGVSFEYNINDLLTITGDLSVSKTERRENLYHTRLQSEPTDILGNPVEGASDSGYINTAIEIGQNGSLIPIMQVRNFDVTNPNNFADAARTRVDLNQFRNNTISAFRTDFQYLVDSDFISQIKGGVRFSSLEFDSAPRSRDEFTNNDDDVMYEAIARCQNDSFPESGFLSSVTGGQPLITNVDSDGNVIEQGTGNAFASFDPLCLASAVIGDTPVYPEAEQTLANVDVEEKTKAVYIQADFDTLIGDYGVRGNFGLRYVNTDVSSIGLRSPLVATYADSDGDGIDDIVTSIDGVPGEFFEVAGGSNYTELLPSVNVVVDLTDEVLLRGAVYRALSRPSPSDMGFGRTFNGLSDDSGDPESLTAAIGTATANGNPNIQPFTSWNGDVAIEWYPNEDTILAFGVYYKSFEGGFENTSVTETFNVEGEDLETIVTTQQTTEDTTSIYGVEMTATHAFNYLPGFLSNFGVKLSYNWADSDFEVEDGNFGSSTIIDPDTGSEVGRVGIVPPAEIFGFSDTVISSQFYYQEGDFNAQLIYKYRSEYFQQYVSTPQNLRYVGDTGVYEARVSYKLNKNLKVSLEAINLFDEPKRQFNPTPDNFSEINVYGPRIYAGFQYKL
ncbi:TonB-dependent receptor [Paraglaciecola sp. L3A3]|uniref:TonB-dependent receptor n=1 Tax=Paraglaciecola sp. L3A3 TaxID=2686358 RepID=UPI00131DACCA|nr:TonB-dependent receptor [Paraglaciecola sp. L3A3]